MSSNNITWAHMNAAETAFRERLRTNPNIPEGQREIPAVMDRWIWDALGAAMHAAVAYERDRKPNPYNREALVFRPELRPEEV